MVKSITPPILPHDADGLATLRAELSRAISPIVAIEDAELCARCRGRVASCLLVLGVLRPSRRGHQYANAAKNHRSSSRRRRCRAVANNVSIAHPADSDAKQESFDLDGAAAIDLRQAMLSTARRAVHALAPAFSDEEPLDPRLCLRRYAAGETRQRLGPHVDDTLCTLLWATGPGLEVLAPVVDDWTGEDVARVGLPTMGPMPRAPAADDWAVVALPPDCLLLNPGHAWARCAATSAAVPLRAATLHRVVLGGEERLSLPLLVGWGG